MSLRQVLMRRVSSVLYRHLKDEKLKSWDASDVIALSQAIIIENMPIIENYLKEKDVNLDNLDGAIGELVEKILIPKIRFK